MATALYRRYRPDTFDEVVGQDHVTGPLKAALANGRVNHAYLFSGPRGCGKTTSARILARCLNCAEGPTPTPCGHCESCRDLATGGPGSLDVVEIDAASHNGVDDARDLRERAVYAPARDRFKVFILDEAHMVTPQGFNALLKLVEEPPEHVKFIFATTEPEKVIGTIRSRTHHYPFRLVPPEVMGNYLSDLCQRENVPVGKGVLPLVVRAGGGSVRDSLSVLDQLMAGATADGIDYHTAVALLGYTPDSLLGDIVDAFSAGDGAAVFRVVDRVVETGQDPRRFVEDLLERFRDLIVLATAPNEAAALLPDAPEDRLERLLQQAQSYGRAELSRAADLLNTGLTQMTGATSPRLQLELICARILLPGGENTRNALLTRLDRMERRIGMASAGNVPGAPSQADADAVGAGNADSGAAAGGPSVGGAPAQQGVGGSQTRSNSAQPESTQYGQDSPANRPAADEPAANRPVASDGAPADGAPADQAAPRQYENLDDLADIAAAAESLATEDLQPPREARPSAEPAPEPAQESQGDERVAADPAQPPETAPSPESKQRSEPRQQSQPVQQPQADVREQSRPPETHEQTQTEPQKGTAPTQQPPSAQQPSSAQAPAAGTSAAQEADRRESNASASAAPTPPSAPEATAAQSGTQGQPDVPGGDEIDAIRRNWTSILDSLGKSSRLAKAILSSNAVPLGVQDGAVQLGFNNQGSARGFDRNANDQKLSQAIYDELGLRVSVVIAQVGIDLDSAMADFRPDGPATGRASHGGGRYDAGASEGPTDGHPDAGDSDADDPGQRPEGTAQGRHRPSQEEIDAVVGKRAMDREPVDHNKFWQSPPDSGPWAQSSGPGQQDGGQDNPGQHGNPGHQAHGRESSTGNGPADNRHGHAGPSNHGSSGSDDADQEADLAGWSVPDEHHEDHPGAVGASAVVDSGVPAAQSESYDLDESSGSATADTEVVDTSAGAGAVDAPAVVVPPPADDMEPWDDDAPYDGPDDAAYGYPDGPDSVREDDDHAAEDQAAPSAEAYDAPDFVQPSQNVRQPADDLDFLGAYADPDISFSGTGATFDGTAGGQAHVGPTDPRMHGNRDSQAPGSGSGGGFGTSNLAGSGQHRPNPFADLAARHAPGANRSGSNGGQHDGPGTDGYDNPAPGGSGSADYPGDPAGMQGDNGYGSADGPENGSGGGSADPGDVYMDVDPENDLDISESGELGIPVVERLLGGVVIEELDE